MTTPLSENQGHVDYLRRRLRLGTLRGGLSGVHGGFHHRMWRLETERGTYAVKQLAPDTDVADADTISHYNVAERVAETFAARGIAAIFALRAGTDYLQVADHTGYLVYPWTDATAQELSRLSESHALEVARVLARMHTADIRVPGVRPAPTEVHPEEKITGLVRWAGEQNIRAAHSLRSALPVFLEIAAAQRLAARVLETRLVVSHGDLDQKNVLWDDRGKPVLIDWESARLLNPTYECLLEAMDWSGITARFDEGLFEKFLAAYKEAGGVIEHGSIDASLHCILGDWLDWLMYNVGRAVDLADEEQRQAGAEQIEFTLSTLLRVWERLPALSRVAAGLAVEDDPCLT